MLAAEEFAVGGSRYLCIPEVSSNIIGAMAKLKSHNLVHVLLLDYHSSSGKLSQPPKHIISAVSVPRLILVSDIISPGTLHLPSPQLVGFSPSFLHLSQMPPVSWEAY